MKTHKHKCGCVSEVGDREQWVSMCTEHETEFQDIHQRWAEEHKAKSIIEVGIFSSDFPQATLVKRVKYEKEQTVKRKA